jgi:hypothetical protein
MGKEKAPALERQCMKEEIRVGQQVAFTVDSHIAHEFFERWWGARQWTDHVDYGRLLGVQPRTYNPVGEGDIVLGTVTRVFENDGITTCNLRLLVDGTGDAWAVGVHQGTPGECGTWCPHTNETNRLIQEQSRRLGRQSAREADITSAREIRYKKWQAKLEMRRLDERRYVRPL